MKLRNHKPLTCFLGILLMLGILANSPALGQKLALKLSSKPFEPGEELTYKAEISKSLLRKLDVATFKFSTDRESSVATKNADESLTNSERNSFRFTGDVSSDGFFTKLFNVNFHQHIVSTVEPESFAVQKTLKLDEQGKRVRESEANFDQKKGKVVWTERDPNDPNRVPRTASSDFSGQVQDVLSAIYYLRTQQLDLGKSFAVTISDSGRVYQVPVHVIEKRHMKTVLGSISVVRVDPELFGEHSLLNSKGQFSVWLTDDYRHIPVKAQLKGQYGTFDITLKKVSHQSTPPTLVKK